MFVVSYNLPWSNTLLLFTTHRNSMNLSLYLYIVPYYIVHLLSEKLESKRQKCFGLNLIGRQEHAIFVIQPNATVTPAVVVAIQ